MAGPATKSLHRIVRIGENDAFHDIKETIEGLVGYKLSRNLGIYPGAYSGDFRVISPSFEELFGEKGTTFHEVYLESVRGDDDPVH